MDAATVAVTSRVLVGDTTVLVAWGVLVAGRAVFVAVLVSWGVIVATTTVPVAASVAVTEAVAGI